MFGFTDFYQVKIYNVEEGVKDTEKPVLTPLTASVFLFDSSTTGKTFGGWAAGN